MKLLKVIYSWCARNKSSGFEKPSNVVVRELKCTEHIVCFADIIGFKERVLSMNAKEEDEEIKKLKFCFTKIVGQSEWEKSKYPLQINVYSDCFTMAWELNESNPRLFVSDIFSFIYEILLVQGNFVAQGLLLRGGITIGRYYADEKFIFGKALIRAHELEQKERVPLIILDETEIVNSIKGVLNLTKKNKGHYDGGRRGLTYDLDDIFGMFSKKGKKLYLDYIKSYKECDSPEQSEKLLRMHRKIIVKGLGHKQEKVRRKYVWLGKYHNRAIGVLSKKHRYLTIPIKLLITRKLRRPKHNRR